jgi:hypothetical protein
MGEKHKSLSPEHPEKGEDPEHGGFGFLIVLFKKEYDQEGDKTQEKGYISGREFLEIFQPAQSHVAIDHRRDEEQEHRYRLSPFFAGVKRS